jgi:hypothetical protein
MLFCQDNYLVKAGFPSCDNDFIVELVVSPFEQIVVGLVLCGALFEIIKRIA